jgi:hypothetical protein
MISQDDIDAFEEGNLTDSLHADIKRALMGVRTALHYLEETGHVKSEELDTAHDQLRSVELNMEKLLNAN